MSTRKQNYKILMVEDTDLYADMMQVMLKRLGLEAIHAPTGKAALDYINEHKPDLILLDLNLGGMTGWEVLEAVKKKYGEREVPVIVTTAFSDSANRLVGKLQDVNQYLVKPFTADEFRSKVANALELDHVEA